MNPSTSMSDENKEVEQLHPNGEMMSSAHPFVRDIFYSILFEQLRAFIDETTAEVAEARNKFNYQEDLVEAFNGDGTSMGYVAAMARADKFEARLAAARARQESAYNRYAATLE